MLCMAWRGEQAMHGRQRIKISIRTCSVWHGGTSEAMYGRQRIKISISELRLMVGEQSEPSV